MWGKLWLHESERVYADRLVSQQVSRIVACGPTAAAQRSSRPI
jgi:hypothetical protein